MKASAEKHNRALRVLQLGPWAPPHGGVQTHVAAIHNSLIERGAISRVINIAHSRKDSVPNIYFPQNALSLAALLISVPADIVHIHVGDLRPALIGLAALISTLPRRRTILTFHSGRYAAPVRRKDLWVSSAMAATLNRFDAVICVNPQLVDSLAARGLRRDVLRYIAPHPAVPRRSLPELPESLAAFAQEHPTLIVAVGLLEPEYNVPFLFDSIARLRRHDPQAGLIVIGTGSLAADLRQRREEHPAREAILLAGDVPHPITLSVVARSAAMLRATSWDGDSISIREAVELGVPVVASDTGARPPQVRCFPLGDLDICIARLRHAIGEAARSDSGGPAEGNIEKVIALYERLSGLTVEAPHDGVTLTAGT